MRVFFGIIFCLTTLNLWAQGGEISGKVFDASSNEPLSFATVVLQNTSFGALSDEKGDFVIRGVNPGLYNIMCSFVGYQNFVKYEVEVTTSRAVNLQIGLQPALNGITLVIEGVEAGSQSKTAADAVARVREYEAAGMDRKGAISTVADEFDLPKKIVYAAVVDANKMSR